MTDLRSVHTVPSLPPRRRATWNRGHCTALLQLCHHPRGMAQLLPGHTDHVQRGAGLRSCHHNQHMMPEPGWPQQSTLVPTAMAWSHQPGHCGGHSPGDCGGDT
ncbi:hypothetical protein DV515_00009415 [Chloebia gouldiae]|uniref:Uncharacterized protein n=1 Tax=Chloebia gouldiae TaxID=44316 RepID=A0A3L8SCJ0_CHLGU|nr:hypothetical protein DV515_00009415 [Chloebia gouldiae]